MIEWIKTTFFSKPNKTTPLTAEWLNKFQDFCMQIGLIKDYVVDSGANSNGSWEKWASGKLVQWGNTSVSAGQSPSSVGSTGYYENTGYLTDYPINFVGTPMSTVSFRAGTIESMVIRTYQSSASGLGMYRSMTWQQFNNVTISYSWYAIGRWK